MKFIVLTRTDGVQVLVNLSDVFEIIECEDYCVVLFSSISDSKRSFGLHVTETMSEICKLIDAINGVQE